MFIILVRHHTIGKGDIMSEHISTLSQKTADILKKQITDKKLYKPGDRLPNENRLSESFSVSRTTLREAIKILVSEGILVVRRGKGTYVNDTFDRSLGNAPLPTGSVTSQKVTLRDLYEVRLIIEPKAAAMAAKRATDGEIKEILKLGKRVQAEIKKNAAGDGRMRSECDFHTAILKASHNDYISSFSPVLVKTIENTFELNENLELIAKDAYQDHITIMGFLKSRDPEGVESAMIIHLRHAMEHEDLSF